MTWYYYRAYDDGDAIVRVQKSGRLERYDAESKSWVFDRYMFGILSGDVPARRITKEEVDKRIAAMA